MDKNLLLTANLSEFGAPSYSRLTCRPILGLQKFLKIVADVALACSYPPGEPVHPTPCAPPILREAVPHWNPHSPQVPCALGSLSRKVKVLWFLLFFFSLLSGSSTLSSFLSLLQKPTF